MGLLDGEFFQAGGGDSVNPHGQWGMFTCTKPSVAPEKSLTPLGVSVQDELFPVKDRIFL